MRALHKRDMKSFDKGEDSKKSDRYTRKSIVVTDGQAGRG